MAGVHPRRREPCLLQHLVSLCSRSELSQPIWTIWIFGALESTGSLLSKTRNIQIRSDMKNASHKRTLLPNHERLTQNYPGQFSCKVEYIEHWYYLASVLSVTIASCQSSNGIGWVPILCIEWRPMTCLLLHHLIASVFFITFRSKKKFYSYPEENLRKVLSPSG